MKVKQVVTFEAANAWFGYSNVIEFHDADGNEVNITMSDSAFTSFAERVAKKLKEKVKRDAEKARELLEEAENEA